MKFGITKKGWKEFKELLFGTPFERRLKKHLQAATNLNAEMGADKVKRDIYSGKYKENADLTVILKGSSRPLVDGGNLTNSIVGKAISYKTGLVGVYRMSQETRRTDNAKRPQAANVAYFVHFGVTVPVTAKMRRYFYYLSKKDPRIKPLSERTVAIVIPPRPFLEAAIHPDMYRYYKANWEMATLKAMRGDK